MTTATMFHCSKCSKSRATLELLKAKGVDVTVVDYLNSPPTIETLQEIAQALGTAASRMVRTKEPQYAELGLSDATAPSDLLEAIHAHPVLLERPIVLVSGRAAIGRPPEAVLRLFDVQNP